jgi:hypothetical protein
MDSRENAIIGAGRRQYIARFLNNIIFSYKLGLVLKYLSLLTLSGERSLILCFWDSKARSSFIICK